MTVNGENAGRAAAAAPPAGDATLRHEAVFYRTPAEYRSAVLPFVADGLARGEAVLVALPGAAGEAIRLGLDGQAAGASFTDMAQLGRNPSRIISALWDLVDRGHGQPARFVGEHIWPGRSAAEIREAQAREAAINTAFAAVPLTVLCPYDAARLPAEITDAVARTHPVLRAGQRSWRSPEFGAGPLPGLTSPALAPPPATAGRLDYTTDLRAVREFVAGHARAAGLDEDRAADLVLAAGEVAANTIAHTAGGGTLVIWRTGTELICQVTDHGQITDPLVGLRRPAETRGLGLWVVHQVCDLVELRSDRAGTTVRMHVCLPRRGET
jgi:anti-sigma regulatory factor (Ser/Thr protein kinase)